MHNAKILIEIILDHRISIIINIALCVVKVVTNLTFTILGE
jgi:hypothetical protein